MPRSQVDVELAPSLSLIRGARHIHIKLVGACLLRHALRSPQEILQAAKSRVVASEDVQAQRRAVCCRRRRAESHFGSEWGSVNRHLERLVAETYPNVKFRLQQPREEATSGRSSMRRDSAPFICRSYLTRVRVRISGAVSAPHRFPLAVVARGAGWGCCSDSPWSSRCRSYSPETALASETNSARFMPITGRLGTGTALVPIRAARGRVLGSLQDRDRTSDPRIRSESPGARAS